MSFWPIAVCCHRCASPDTQVLARPADGARMLLRSVWKCGQCGHEFTVTVTLDPVANTSDSVERIVAYHDGTDTRGRSNTRTAPVCGSERGYRRCKASTGVACAHCRAAHTAYEQSRRAGHPNSTDLVVPFPTPMFGEHAS